MACPLKHAESSARKFGGKAEDYLPVHNWFDESKAFFSVPQRALRPGSTEHDHIRIRDTTVVLAAFRSAVSTL